MNTGILSIAVLLWTGLVGKNSATRAPFKEAKHFGLALVLLDWTELWQGWAFFYVVLTEPQPALKFLSFRRTYPSWLNLTAMEKAIVLCKTNGYIISLQLHYSESKTFKQVTA